MSQSTPLTRVGTIEKHKKYAVYTARQYGRLFVYVFPEQHAPYLSSLTAADIARHSVRRVISNTAYVTGGKIQFYDFLHKDFLPVFRDLVRESNQHLPSDGAYVGDNHLTEIVKLCEGADDGDDEQLIHLEHVTQWDGLAGGDLGFLGYPGKGQSVLRGYDYGGNEEIWLETIQSYTEGYRVQHMQLSRELWWAFRAPEIVKIFGACTPVAAKEADNAI